MAEVQREPLDPVAVRSKIYGITPPPNSHLSRSHHSQSNKRTATDGRHPHGKQKQGNHSTSFLPQVAPGGHQQIAQSADGNPADNHEPSHEARHDADVDHDTRHIRRAASAHSALGGTTITASHAAAAAGPISGTVSNAMAIQLTGANAITAANLSHFARAFDAAQAQGAAALAQTERLRVLLREKEIEMIRLKHENVLLKQIDRRHQKEIEQFEAQAVEAPRIIKGLREELSHLKHKIKVYFVQIGEDSRQIRQIDEERRRLREHNIRLERLVSEKNLADRDTLNTQLEEANKKMLELEKSNSDTLKKAEFTERNLMNDNRQLRGKIHHLERENILIRDRVEKLEETVHEKDKAIASLSIYRYNAIHRKQDAVCKVCLKREKEESENRRRQQIREKLPELQQPSLLVVSPTSVRVNMAIPSKSETVHFSKIVLHYSDDPARLESRKSKTIALQEADFGKESKEVSISDLSCGKVYYFSIAAAHDDVVGEFTKPEMVLVDKLPQAPTSIKTSVSLSPTAVRISFSQPEPNSGSSITHYRLYTSPTSSFAEKFLVADTEIEDLYHEKDGSIAVVYNDPSIAVPMFFRVAAVNTMGQGVMSETSTETVVDFAPNQPAKPVVKRISSSSVQVVSHVEPNRGSPVHSFVVVVQKLEKNDADLLVLMDKRETVVPTLHAHPYDLVHTVDGLERGTTYKFCVQASNGGGDSAMSDYSEDVNIDVLVPAPGDLSVEILTSSSVRAILPSVTEIEKPKIIGFKILWSSESDMIHILASTSVIPTTTTDYVIDHLDEGSSFYFAVCLVGEHEEGVCSSPVFVPLAAAYTLPPSPIPVPDSSESGLQDADGSWSGNMLVKTGSKGSNLSLNQRVANMHHGMPAYHDPPVDDSGGMSPRMGPMSPRRSLDGNSHGDDGGHDGVTRDGRDGGSKRRAGGNAAGKAVNGLPSKNKGTGRSIGNIHNTGGSSLDRPGKSTIAARSSSNLAGQPGGAAKHRAVR